MKKQFYYVELENISPLHIGNGDNEYTDLDLLLDKDGNFYIPGTSMAGACIHSLNTDIQKKLQPSLKDDSKLSPVFFSDAYMIEETIIETRDGILLDDNKQTVEGGKYDYQILPAGYHFILRLETTNYPGDETDYRMIVDTILSNINNQTMRIGFKTTRGLGLLKVVEAAFKEFNDGNITDIFEFDKYNKSSYETLEIKECLSNYYVFTADLSLAGGISIRTYNTTPEESDYIHINSAGKPVIPGTSWNGLLRKSFKTYAKLLGKEELENKVFGYMEEGESFKSKVLISESTIEGGEEITQTRTSIDRFYGGASTSKRGLFTETAHYGGDFRLVVSFDSSLKEDMPIIKNIMECIFADLNDGLISIGGLASIGRGICKVNRISYQEPGKAEKVC